MQKSNETTLSQLREGFTHPPKEAKVRTWWHWLDGNVTAEGITADLEEVKKFSLVSEVEEEFKLKTEFLNSIDIAAIPHVV